MRVQETDWGYIEWMEPEYPGMGSEEASLRTGTVYVEPGKTMLRHVHYEEQFVYVLEGRGIGYINGEPQIFEPGARFHMPAGCTHEFVNTGDVPLACWWWAGPAPGAPRRAGVSWLCDSEYIWSCRIEK
ncbi:MAG: cupin domain-containing protein [Lachnospiraceae bacterium]